MAPFSEAAYAVIARVPAGRVSTYGQVARLMGRPQSARYVGFALRCAPAGLPCHRIVHADGSLAGGNAFGGPGAQRALLEAEGVAFLPNGRVDMRRFLWDGNADA